MVGGIGTVVDNAAIPSSLWSATLRHGYVGCMRDLIVNGNAVDLAAFARQQDSGKYGEHLNERQQRNEVRCKSPSYRVSSMQSSLKETLRLLRSIELVQVQLALVFFPFCLSFSLCSNTHCCRWGKIDRWPRRRLGKRDDDDSQILLRQ